MRYLSLFLPNWSVDLIKQKQPTTQSTSPSDKAYNSAQAGNQPPLVLLTAAEANQTVIKRCCPLAYHAGVREGFSLPLAQAIAPTAITAPFDSLRDFKSLYRLALYLTRVSPLVGIDTDLFYAFQQNVLDSASRLYTGISIDITGTERLHGGEAAIAHKILTFLTTRGFVARLAIAPTLGAAWALARYSPKRCTILKDSPPLKKALADLPLAALRISADIETRLHELGIDTLGKLFKLPSKTLGERFGIILLRRLHQLLGVIEEPFVTLTPGSPPALTRKFEVPLQRHEALQYTVVGLFDKLLVALSLHGVRARGFMIIIEGLSSSRERSSVTREITLNTVTNNLGQIRGIITPIIERIRFAEGVTKITIKALQVEPLHAEQENFIDGSAGKRRMEAATELVNALSLRVGAEQVCHAAFHQSYIPERSFSFRPIPRNYIKLINTLPKESSAALNGSPPTMLLPDRPPYLLTQPAPASALALLPDKAPVRLRWRDEEHEIITGIGPERVMPEWWKGDASTERDYFKLQTKAGIWLWVFRARSDLSWWVHGMWV